MKIEKVRIINFRSIKDQEIGLGDFCCFVGTNGVGKSNIFNALNVFFRQYRDSRTDLSRLTEEDFHHKNTSNPIEITVTFSELSSEAEESLSDYVRHGKLIVTAKAEYDENTGHAEVKQYGNRLVVNEFRPWFEAEKAGAKVAELKSIYGSLQVNFADLNSATTKAAMIDALRDFEDNNPDKCSLAPSEDQFYGASKGANRLAPHIQWVFIPASKDVAEEAQESKNSALGSLLSRAVRAKVDFASGIEKIRKSIATDYDNLLAEHQDALTGLSQSLQEKLRIWSNPGVSVRLQWKHDSNRSIRVEEPLAGVQIGEKGFEAELARFGHGMQRSYLLTLLQELAELDDSTGPTLVMAVEEPELYQHPPQAKYLSQVLQDLSLENSQILVCTHSPYFIPGDKFHCVRIIREAGKPACSMSTSLTYDELTNKLEECGEKHISEDGILAKLYPSLRPELSEMFFCQRLVLVEGLEDVAYLTSYVELMNLGTEFRKGGFHIVPVGGKSELIKPLAISKLLEIPVYIVCDGDTDEDREDRVTKHKKDNAMLLKLLELDESLVWPVEDVLESGLCMWKTNITNTISDDIGTRWNGYQEQARRIYGSIKGLQKNPLAVSRALENAWNDGYKSARLEAVVNQIVDM